MKKFFLFSAWLIGLNLLFSQNSDEQLLNDFVKDLCFCSKDEFNKLHPKVKDFFKALAIDPEKAQQELMASISTIPPGESEKFMESLLKINDGSLKQTLEDCNEKITNNSKYPKDFLDRVMSNQFTEKAMKILEQYPECETFKYLVIIGNNEKAKS